jgi:hydroxyacylglutathione hydrolase
MEEMFIVKRMEVGCVNNCTYVIFNAEEKAAILVDPAWDLEKILKCINENDVTISAILLTHSHHDHTNLVAPLVEKFHCKVYMSSKEIDFYGFESDNLIPVSDSEIIKIGNLQFDCILTPGHTAGSMCFRIGNILFTGDTVFIRSCGFCNCKGSNYNEMFESIKKIKVIVQEGIAIYPGHYFRDDMKYEKEYLKRNIYFHINDKKTFEKFIALSGERNIYLKYEY